MEYSVKGGKNIVSGASFTAKSPAELSPRPAEGPGKQGEDSLYGRIRCNFYANPLITPDPCSLNLGFKSLKMFPWILFYVWGRLSYCEGPQKGPKSTKINKRKWTSLCLFVITLELTVSAQLHPLHPLHPRMGWRENHERNLYFFWQKAEGFV